MSQKYLLSVVIPVYNEEQVIHAFYKRLKTVLASLGQRCSQEIIFVDDGSSDSSLKILREISKKDHYVRAVSLSRNFGHQIAITAGIDIAEGDTVVVIDADLQDPPELIPEMYAKWEEGYKVVYGVRKKRKGETIFKLMTAKFFYRILGKLSKIEIPFDTGDFRLIDRVVVDVLKSIREDDRYIRGLIAWIGFPHYALEYERDIRYAGETKYPLGKMIRFAWDGITGFSNKPLYLSSLFGIIITLVSFLLILWYLINKFLNPESSIPGWTSLIVLILFLGGIQLFSLGIIGQYIGRIHRGIKHRPLYIIAEKYGFDNTQNKTVLEKKPSKNSRISDIGE
jgi:glycosyltransferase involved in cell wall biosynthesis